VTITQVGMGDHRIDGGLAVEDLEHVVARCAADLPDVDPRRVVVKTFGGLHEGADHAEAARLVVQSAAELIGEEPQYSKLAARLLSDVIADEAAAHGRGLLQRSIALGHAEGLIGDETAAFVKAHAEAFDAAIDPDGDLRFEYFGLRTVYDRYLLRHPVIRDVIETPQYFMLRVACGLSRTPEEAIELLPADVLARLPAELADAVQLRHPAHPDVLLLPLDSPRDELDSIYARYHQVARCRSSPAASASASPASARAAR
jgi:ribonucleoside-diphosphate reductase alpha chain